MTQYNIRHLLVTDSGELKGVISDRDIMKVAVCDNHGIVSFPHKTVDEIMVSDLKVCDFETTTSQICKMMMDNKIDCVPIIEDGEVHGLITSMDLIALLSQYDGLKREQFKFDFHIYNNGSTDKD